MPQFYMETTTISPERTVGEIITLLVKSNAKHIQHDYDGGKLLALSFMLELDGILVPFKLPCRSELLERRFRELGKRAKKGETLADWARRVAWRQVKRWLEAQLALIETGMVRFEEVMLPYMQLGARGQTVYEAIKDKHFSPLSLTDRRSDE